MNRQRRKAVLWLGLMLVLSVVITFASACEQGVDITFENRSNQDVSIYSMHVRYDGSTDEPIKEGGVSTNETRTFPFVFIGADWIIRIKAEEPSGKAVFSHDYKMADLEKIGCKIIIPP